MSTHKATAKVDPPQASNIVALASGGLFRRPLSRKEAAAFLGVSRDTVQRMIDSGELRAHKVRSQWRIEMADLEAIVQAGQRLQAQRSGKGTK